MSAKKIYPDVSAFLYHRSEGKKGPLYAEEARKLLGWTEVKSGDFTFRDKAGKKILCKNNDTNRPFNKSTAEDWKLEIGRGKWKFNGESLVLDEYGKCQDCQHRLAALAWCHQEWEAGKWRDFWKNNPPFIEGVLVVGVQANDDTINTLGVGRTRSLSDALYRSRWFKQYSGKERRYVARMTESAIKLVWDRTVYKKGVNVYAPRRPHSESLTFLEKHPGLLDAVNHVYAEDGDTQRLTTLMVPGVLAGLLYMMGAVRTEFSSYKEQYEEGIDWGTWDSAEKFITLLSHGTDGFELLRAALQSYHESGLFFDRCRIALLITAFNEWIETERLSKTCLHLDIEKDEYGDDVLYDMPNLGGIDIGGDPKAYDGDNEDNE